MIFLLLFWEQYQLWAFYYIFLRKFVTKHSKQNFFHISDKNFRVTVSHYWKILWIEGRQVHEHPFINKPSKKKYRNFVRSSWISFTCFANRSVIKMSFVSLFPLQHTPHCDTLQSKCSNCLYYCRPQFKDIFFCDQSKRLKRKNSNRWHNNSGDNYLGFEAATRSPRNILICQNLRTVDTTIR